MEVQTSVLVRVIMVFTVPIGKDRFGCWCFRVEHAFAV